MPRGGAIALVTAAVSGAVTLAVALSPRLHFVFWQPMAHVALETAAALTALLAGFLVFARLWRDCRLNELLLTCALALLALLNLFFLTVPALAGLAPPGLVIWDALTGSSLAAAFFALAAFVPRRRLRRPGLMLAGAAAGVAAAVLVAALIKELVERLPSEAVAPASSPSPVPPDLQARPGVLMLLVLIALLYGTAAAGFFRRSRRAGEEFLGWLAIAAVLAAASHVNYLLYPSLYSSWVHVGDFFRLCFYAVLLAGSMREIWSYWRALPAAAVAEERRRIARDLHDGLAQELVYLARNLDSLGPLDKDTNGDALKRLRRAVERAQFESRWAVSTLTAPTGQATETTLANAVGEIAERFHLGLELDLVPGVRLPAARTDALVRIACEAVTNAARHSGSSRVRLNMESDGPLVRLRVSDKGRGFNTAAPGSGFGLVSMCERAHSVGGEMRISSAPGQGSEVEVAL
jgi:signal transduction histidine kinase